MSYHKTLWQRFRFTDVSQGEDTKFIWTVPKESLIALTENTFYVATVHSRNTSRKQTTGSSWQPISPVQIRELIGADVANGGFQFVYQ